MAKGTPSKSASIAGVYKRWMFCFSSMKPSRCQSCVSVSSVALPVSTSRRALVVQEIGEIDHRRLFFADDDQIRGRFGPVDRRAAMSANQLLGIAARHAGQLAHQRHAQAGEQLRARAVSSVALGLVALVMRRVERCLEPLAAERVCRWYQYGQPKVPDTVSGRNSGDESAPRTE